MDESDSEREFESADEGDGDLQNDLKHENDATSASSVQNKLATDLTSCVQDGNSMKINSEDVTEDNPTYVVEHVNISDEQETRLGCNFINPEVPSVLENSVCASAVVEGATETKYLEGTVAVKSDIKSTSKGEHSQEVTPTRILESRVHDCGQSSQTLTEQEKSVLDKLSMARDGSDENHYSKWDWGGWGSSLISTATSSVGTFTSQVKQGLSSVLETVEAGLGVPSPEELAKGENKAEPSNISHFNPVEGKTCETSAENPGLCEDNPEMSADRPLVNFSNILSGVSVFTNVVEQTGSRVISGSLNTLEIIGRTAMDIIQEGDPGLKKKRAFFEGAKPDLSKLLREAKDKAVSVEQETDIKKTKVNFTSIFDEHQGLVHLEALEMLSKQHEGQVQSILLKQSNSEDESLQEDLDKIQELLTDLDVDDTNVDGESDQDFYGLVTTQLLTLNVGINADKLTKASCTSRQWLDECQQKQNSGVRWNAEEIHDHAISCLAEFTAKSIEIIHKLSEMFLIKNENKLKDAEELSRFVKVLCTEVAILSAKYSTCLNTAADDSEEPDLITPLITNVYLEASNSSTYIQDAVQLVVPILQYSHFQQK